MRFYVNILKPIWDDANMEIALTYMSSEKFSDAIPYLQKVIQSTATDAYKPRAYYTLGTAYYNLDKTKRLWTRIKL